MTNHDNQPATEPERVHPVKVKRIGVIMAIGLALVACGAGSTQQPREVPTPGQDEGNYVTSWCAHTASGFRVFFAGGGNSATMAVVADPTCHGGQR